MSAVSLPQDRLPLADPRAWERLLRAQGVPRRGRGVLPALVRGFGRSWFGWWSCARLGELAGYSADTAARLLRDLEASGWIHRVRYWAGHVRRQVVMLTVPSHIVLSSAVSGHAPESLKASLDDKINWLKGLARRIPGRVLGVLRSWVRAAHRGGADPRRAGLNPRPAGSGPAPCGIQKESILKDQMKQQQGGPEPERPHAPARVAAALSNSCSQNALEDEGVPQGKHQDTAPPSPEPGRREPEPQALEQPGVATGMRADTHRDVKPVNVSAEEGTEAHELTPRERAARARVQEKIDSGDEVRNPAGLRVHLEKILGESEVQEILAREEKRAEEALARLQRRAERLDYRRRLQEAGCPEGELDYEERWRNGPWAWRVSR